MSRYSWRMTAAEAASKSPLDLDGLRPASTINRSASAVENRSSWVFTGRSVPEDNSSMNRGHLPGLGAKGPVQGDGHSHQYHLSVH